MTGLAGDGASLQVLEAAVVVTMDPSRSVVRDGAVAVRGSRIAAVGSRSALAVRYPDAPRRSWERGILAPGLVNLHTHAALSLLRSRVEERGWAPAYTPGLPQGERLSESDCEALALLGGLEALRFGSTTLVDNYVHAHAAARAFTRLGVRAIVSERLHDADLDRVPGGVYRFEPAIRARLVARTEALLSAYPPSAGRVQAWLGPHAPDTCSSDLLAWVADAAARRGVGVLIHLLQSRGEARAVSARGDGSPVALLARAGLLEQRVVAAHCLYPEPGDVDTLGSAPLLAVAHCPVSNAKGGAAAPVAELRVAGVTVGLGTDNYAGDMVEAMRAALLVGRIRSGSLSPTALEVLEMATLGGARALGMEREIGSLEPGKWADLVIFDAEAKAHLAPFGSADPVALLVHAALGSDVDSVLVAGEVVLDGGLPTRVTPEAVLAEAETVAAARWAEAG